MFKSTVNPSFGAPAHACTHEKEPKLGKRQRIKTVLMKMWTKNCAKNPRSDVSISEGTNGKNYLDSTKGCVLEQTKSFAFPAEEEVPSTASSQVTNGSTLTLRSFCGSSVLSEDLETQKVNSGTDLPRSSAIPAEQHAIPCSSAAEMNSSKALDKPCYSTTKKAGLYQRPEAYKDVSETAVDETWIAKCLKDYCPVRFRRIKHLDYESPEFRSKQLSMALHAVADQERREGDYKVRFRPERGRSKPFLRGLLHFEMDEDIVDSLEDFIASNRGLPSLFTGTGPAVRRHFFRRWKNVDRDKAIIYDHLKRMWSLDKRFVKQLKMARELRSDELEDRRFLEELFNGPSDRFPPFSFFTNRLTTKLKSLRTPAEQEQRLDGVPPERSISSHPYFALQKRRAKIWIKNLLLSI
ncbi:hypothetical protein HG536_0F03270 [Torulaspora globosa]|uniref:Uncharacterized protein n=1 Tax=Torulaspora globosa TaxID=48254 RepID=A0A7G3ZKG6_9SACH|nr:uncharacterized protein HG536_0F03270 [Torulaspora globosa]QLL34002.1 hypothetical protein HG536_0F03270 [Torulaspora globosa]